MINNKNTKIELILILLMIVGGIILCFASMKMEKEIPKINYNSTEKDIKKVKGKKNLYFFWGDGCQFCANEKMYLDEFYAKNSDKYQIYGFEVWNNEENGKLLDKFGEELQENTDSVPILVIGQEMVIGFNEKMVEEIEEKLDKSEKEYKDLYEKIKE